MAKLKIKQIEDLAILTTDGVKNIQIGEQIKPLLGIEPEAEGATGYISGLSVEGNNLVIAREALPVVNDGILKLAFGATTTAEGEIFSANATGEKTLTLATVASTGAAADVTVSAIEGLTAGNVQAALAELAQKATDITVTGKDAIKVAEATGEGATGKVVELVIDKSDKVLTQGADGLLANVELSYDTVADEDGKRYIRLTGKNNADLGKIDATDFIKDGMLESAELVTNPEGQEAGKYIKLTFNLTDAQGGNDPIFINVTDLVDVYTADETYITLGTDNKFSHKTQTDLTAGTYGATADATADAEGEFVEFKVPSFTVDAAGHVTKAEDKTIKVELPKPEEAKVYKQGYDYVTLDDSYNNADYTFNIQEGRTAEGTVVAYLNGQALIGVDLAETPVATVADYDYEVLRDSDGKITGVKFHYNLAKLDANLEYTDTVAISYVYYE